MAKIKCNLNINGKNKTVNIHEDKPLIYVIRDELGLIGTKLGCGLGQCGSCAVLIDGEKKNSCNILAKDYQNCKITTIEGLSKEGELSYVQEAWINKDVSQCGYCQAGQIMTATALLEKINDPSDDEIDKAMSGNICRCGTYTRIKKAIKSASSNKK